MKQHKAWPDSLKEFLKGIHQIDLVWSPKHENDVPPF